MDDQAVLKHSGDPRGGPSIHFQEHDFVAASPDCTCTVRAFLVHVPLDIPQRRLGSLNSSNALSFMLDKRQLARAL